MKRIRSILSVMVAKITKAWRWYVDAMHPLPGPIGPWDESDTCYTVTVSREKPISDKTERVVITDSNGNEQIWLVRTTLAKLDEGDKDASLHTTP